MSIRAQFRLAYPGFALGVDLDLPGRGVTALIGRSGSGKTTLLRCIAGLERAPDGVLEINGEVWQGPGVFVPVHRRDLGMVFQEPSLFAHLDVCGNLEYGFKRARTPRVVWDRVVEWLGIGPLLARAPANLSGGERQRVAIARALLCRARLLLLDEPLAALDAERKSEILPILERLRDELEIPVIVVSHAADEVARLADHLVALQAGRVLGAGGLTEMLTRLDLPLAFGEDAGTVLTARVAERDAAWQLVRVEFVGGHLWLPDKGVAIGKSVRVRILARDVSLSHAPLLESSIMNRISATVSAIAPDAHPSQSLVRLNAQGAPLLARVTRRSVAHLHLTTGAQVYAQIKSVALMG